MRSVRFRQNRPLTVYFLLVALSVFLMVVSGAKPAGTIRVFQATVLAPWLKAVRLSYRMALVFRENRLLWEELARLKYERDMLIEMGEENKRLRAIAQFKERADQELIVAEVLSFGSRLQSTSMIIDKGEADGVRENMPVLSLDGLVGRVEHVYPVYSVVMVITDYQCPVSARTSRGRDRGIVEWDVFSGGQLKLKGVPQQARVSEGDLVVTSGLGGVFPEGIEIGSVSSVSDNLDGITLDITIQPAVSFSSLEEVFVLVYEGSTPAFLNPVGPGGR